MTNPGSLPAVRLGDELTVSAIGFGAMALTPGYGEVDDDESLADRRDEVTLATKFGIAGNPMDRAAGGPAIRGDAAYVRQSVEESLARLNTDVIDLYYMHRRDLSVPPRWAAAS